MAWSLMILGVTLCVVFWVLVIGGIAWLIMRATKGQRRSGAADSIDEQFARGEIDRATYLERRGQLARGYEPLVSS